MSHFVSEWLNISIAVPCFMRLLIQTSNIRQYLFWLLSCIKIVTISQSVNEAVSCQQEGVIQFSYCWPNISQSLMNQPIAYKKVVYNCFLVDLTYVLICSFSRSHHQQYVVQITECEAMFTITNYICALQPDITDFNKQARSDTPHVWSSKHSFKLACAANWTLVVCCI